jgi:hypothetical protein
MSWILTFIGVFMILNVLFIFIEWLFDTDSRPPPEPPPKKKKLPVSKCEPWEEFR